MCHQNKVGRLICTWPDISSRFKKNSEAIRGNYKSPGNCETSGQIGRMNGLRNFLAKFLRIKFFGLWEPKMAIGGKLQFFYFFSIFDFLMGLRRDLHMTWPINTQSYQFGHSFRNFLAICNLPPDCGKKKFLSLTQWFSKAKNFYP